jgi:hypothetical protein
MQRIPPAESERFEPVFGAGASPTMRVNAHVPELAMAVVTCSRAFRDARHLPFRLLEPVRLPKPFHDQPPLKGACWVGQDYTTRVLSFPEPKAAMRAFLDRTAKTGSS